MNKVQDFNGHVYVCSTVIAAERGVKTATVTKWAERGLIPLPVKIGKFRFYERDLVNQMLSRGDA